MKYKSYAKRSTILCGQCVLLLVCQLLSANIGKESERESENTENVNDYTTLADDFDT